MIFGPLEQAPFYEALGPRVAAGLRFLAAFDPHTADGRYPLEGERVVALVQRYHTGPGKERRFRSHRRFLEIQYVAAGRERILHAPAAGLEAEELHPAAGDVVVYQDPPASSSVLLGAGDFAILYPGDAHKPGCMAGGRDPVTKVVVRIALEDSDPLTHDTQPHLP